MKKKTAAKAKLKKLVLLTAAQVKASADKPRQRGTPIGELHHLGREIRARVEKLNYHGGKAVDWKDSIDRLLADAAKLCDRKGFEAFKECYCPEFSESWTYQLLAVQEGRKTLEEIRAATRLRVAKHRAAKRGVTESESVTPAEAASGEAEYVEPPAIRLAGGQEVDIEDLGPAAQAQLAEKLLPAATGRNAAEPPDAQRALAEGEADRLDRLFGGAPGMGLCPLVQSMLEKILDEGPQPLESLVKCVDGKCWIKEYTDGIFGGVQGLTSALLDQCADSGLVVPENNVWKLGPAFRTGESLIFTPQYGESTAITVTIWTKDERAEQGRQACKQMALNQIKVGVNIDLHEAFKEGMSWFDDDIFNLPAKVFRGAVSSRHLRKVADLLTRIADEQSKGSDSAARDETRH